MMVTILHRHNDSKEGLQKHKLGMSPQELGVAFYLCNNEVVLLLHESLKHSCWFHSNTLLLFCFLFLFVLFEVLIAELYRQFIFFISQSSKIQKDFSFYPSA
jgi:hypothetical protein